MSTYANKTKQNQAQTLANEPVQRQNSNNSAVKFVDNRPEAIAQRKLQEAIHNSSHVQQQKANHTGLPDNLKAGIENLSGYDISDVKVHYNSDKPAQLQAHAYAQGTDIHLATGQEKHLPHEAWHVVQQKQGRVKPTLQMKGSVSINDDTGLEREADVMGKTAQQYFDTADTTSQKINYSPPLKSVVQRVKINPDTVSPKVLEAFGGLNPLIKLLFMATPKVPGFFEMSDEKKIQYFQGMNMAMPMLQQMIQLQDGPRMIADKTVSPDLNLLHFITLNPTFIKKSISLFNGGGASLNFKNPEGVTKLSIKSLHALLPPPKPSQIGAAGIAIAPAPHHLALMPPRPAMVATHASLHAGAEQAEAALHRERDLKEEALITPLLIKALKSGGVTVPKNITFHQLEIMHATFLYQKESTSLGKKPSMKKYVPNYDVGITQIDIMRQTQMLGPQKATNALLAPLMPQLVALSHFIRLTNYFDSDSEKLIRDSGRLQSKQRRRMKTPGAPVVSKSSETDNELGNTDHVFFFAEYEDQHGPAKFRKTRFSGTADEEDTVLSTRPHLDGSERRVSFPLNSMDPRGIHGYVEDIGSAGVNPIEKVFSGTPVVRDQVHPESQQDFKEQALTDKLVKASAAQSTGAAMAKPPAAAGSGAAAAAATATAASISPPHHEVLPPPGVHLLMDLLRQRFKKTNFPTSIANKGEVAMVQDLLNMKNPKDLYTFLFRKHPRVAATAKEINPQILVPGSVPFSTPGTRFDRPTAKELSDG